MISRRSARQAGTWYPDRPAALEALLQAAIRAAGAAPPSTGPGAAAAGGLPVAALLPHAGLHYSAPGQLHGLAGFAAWKGRSPRVLLLAPSHYFPLDPDRLYFGPYAAYQTPFGDLAGWSPASADPLWNAYPEAVAPEHAVELLLPALAWLVPDAAVCAVLVPEITSQTSLERLTGLLEAELAAAPGPALVLASSDITHYGPRFGHSPFGDADAATVWRRVAERDAAACSLVAAADAEGFLAAKEQVGPTMCGRHPALLLAALAARGGWSGEAGPQYRSDQVEDCPSGAWPGGRPGDPQSPRAGFVTYQSLRFTGQ
jgi:AmmeMemoRadiSam system protein B